MCVIVLLLARSEILLCCFVAVRASSTALHGHEHHKTDVEIAREYRSTLNDIPIPEGSWQEHYDKRNAKWNMMLGASFAFFAVTLYVVCKLSSWLVWQCEML